MLSMKHESGKFQSGTYVRNSEDSFVIRNCEGSLILVDISRTGINKLHIGNLLMRNPHAEIYGSRGEGPRIDLNRIDVRYASERLKEMEKWRDKEYREKLRQRYDALGWYSVPHRLNQLDISPAGLEIKIHKMKELIDYLGTGKESTFVSDTALEIEAGCSKLTEISDNAALYFKRIKSKDNSPKIIVSSSIIESTEEIYSLVKKIFEFAENHPNFDFERAKKYWENVDSWGECRIGDYIFTRYEAEFFKHLKRHFPKGKTVGSIFTEFKSPRKLIDFAWEKLQEAGYNGERKVIGLDFPLPIGLEGVVNLSDIPSGTEVKRETRDGIHKVNVIYGIEKKPTNHLVIIAGPTTRGHGFISIYPGKYYPGIEESPGFWRTHGFIASD
ncbi:hypothetical protein A3K73_00760 [Candidatus Pacearchaeota archaeon RBG_13_36_9]|nr:MAG: hypothetical protein A3K73_00760 [Candidatus Pacearchaeota archaeon RBG_13_36_9]